MSDDMRGHDPARWRSRLEAAGTVAFIAVCVTTVWVLVFRLPGTRPTVADTSAVVRPPRPTAPLPSEPVALDGAVVEGSREAGVALIEYSDPQCPFCAKVARDVLPALREQYVRPGRLLLAFRQFPLTIHAQAQKASEAAACAAAQGKFMELQERLFAEPQRLAETDLREHARQLGLDGPRFDRCLEGEMVARVRADVETGRDLGVSGTPAFFAGVVQADGRVKLRQRINGAQPLGAFQAAIDGLTAAVRQGSERSTR